MEDLRHGFAGPQGRGSEGVNARKGNHSTWFGNFSRQKLRPSSIAPDGFGESFESVPFCWHSIKALLRSDSKEDHEINVLGYLVKVACW